MGSITSVLYLHIMYLSLAGSIGMDCGRADDPSQRRSSQESSIESEQQFSSRRKPTLYVLPFPAILVGYLL